MSYESQYRHTLPFYANEWVNRQKAYQVFFKQLHADGTLPATGNRTVISDHGCGTGDNLSLLANSLSGICGKQSLSIHAVDKRLPMIMEASKRMEATGIESTVSLGDGLLTKNESLRKSLHLKQDDHVSIVLAEHVLYSVINNPEKLKATLESVLSLLHPNGLLISSLSHNSDADAVRARYADMRQDMKEEPTIKLVDAVKELGLRVYEIPIKAKLIDPGLSDNEWNDIASGKIYPGNVPNKKISATLKLFEFSIDNYESLQKKGKLASAVQDFREKIKRGFTIDSTIQIIPSKGSSQDFLSSVENAAKHASAAIDIDGPIYINITDVDDVQSHRARIPTPNRR